MRTDQRARPAMPRAANAMILVLGMLSVLMAVVFIATERGVSATRQVNSFQDGSRSLSAVTAELARRERDVMLLATVGDAANFADWATYFGHENYGVDFIGDCEVRWRIEPARTAPVADPAASTSIPYIVNPSPDPTYAPAAGSTEQPNGTLYMYKVSAEARQLAGSEIVSRAQGSRFVAISREPLFRYVIFYAQRGPKGDLELSHADTVNIQGNIHSNGAIYVGGGLKVNDKLAQRGTFDGNLAATQTRIGPDLNGQPVVSTGVDGVFRLSKSLMFSIVNSLPLTATSLSAAGAPVGDWSDTGSYNVADVLFPTETTVPVGGTPLAKTNSGKVINPYRILSASGAVTQGPDAADAARLFNNVALHGITLATANDARDAERSSSRKWTALAAADFGNRVRTQANGGVPVNLSKIMSNRPFEAQAVTYVDADGDTTTDDHEYARPVFLDPTTGAATFDLPASGPAIESPGTYLALAMGGQTGVAMVRRTGGTGWDMHSRNDLVNPAPESDHAGLIIRERPIPDVAYWPGTNTVDVVDPASPHWLPYAYGKQWYPTIDPFTVADVSDNLFRYRDWDTTTPSVTANINTASANRVAAYSTGGRLSVTAAANPGPSDNGTNGTWSTYSGTSYNGFQRKQYFNRDAWRFVHLNKMQADTVNGLQLAYYQDSPGTAISYWDEKYSAGNSALPFSGTPIAITSPSSAIVTSTSGRLGWATAPATPSTGYWSARWTGFISPTASGSYTFSVATANGSHRVRMWVSNVRVAESGTPSGLPVLNAVSMTAGRFYPVVVEFASTATGAPGLAPVLSWQLTGSASTTIPDTRLFAPKAGFTFDRASLQSVQCRIDNPQTIAGPATQKVGLMIRPDHAVSSVLQGGSPYAMVGWSPTRGFFTQRRQDPATEEQRTVGVFYVGNGSGPSGAVDASGQVPDNPASSSTGWNRTANLFEVARSAVSSPVITYPTTISTPGTTWTSQPTAYAGTMSKDVGGGKIWTILDSFKTGPYVGSQTWTPQRRQSQYVTQTQTVQLRGEVATFLSADDGKNLTIFTTGAANGALIGAASMGYQSSGRAWWFSDGTGAAKAAGFNPATSTPNFLTRIWQGGTQSGAWVNGTPATVSGFTVGSASTAWPVSGSNIRINKNGTVSNATATDIATVTGLGITGILSSASIPTPSLTYPLNTDCPASATAPTVTLSDLTNVGNGRTFSVARTNSTITFDLNSWVTGNATIPGAGQAQYLPQGTGWPATWSGSPSAWPLTTGFRPDVWLTSAAAGPATSTTPATNSTTVLSGTTSVTSGGSITGGNGYAMKDDVKPSGWNTAKEVWLRIDSTPAGTVTFFGYAGTVAPSGPADPGWTAIGNPMTVATWNAKVLAGPCVQSGSISAPTTVTFTDLKVTTTLAAPNDVIDATDWDTIGGSTDNLTRYLMSQYQVFFGTREITEDFFTWRDPVTRHRLADEQWFYDNREFWSQSRWWDHTNAGGARLEKDPFTVPATTFSSTRYRELLAKTTVLDLDLEAIQGYLAQRQMQDAVADVISGIGPAVVTVSSPTTTLASHFNGLIYSARTNRYPWNPNTNPLLPAATTSGRNPWSPEFTSGQSSMPNSVTAPGATPPLIANGAANDITPRNLDAWSDPDLFLAGVHLLQPYVLPEAPAFKPQRWHHGVRLINGQNIHWNYPTGVSTGLNANNGTNWTYPSTPDFGSCRMSVVTPNQLYVLGSLNIDQHNVKYHGSTVLKPTPLAIMGDQVTLLSGAWTDLANQQIGLTVTNVSGASSVGGGGTLSSPTFGPPATASSYQAGIVTNNQPTTRDRVREGQAAPFVDTVLFLENWNNVTMRYLGSLVVLDSRRYSQSFLHDSYKTYGTSPFGIIGASAADPWLGVFSVASPDWIGQSPPVYSEPIRTYAFNYDFLTPEGTPPFVPFGVSSTGAGGWARIVQ